MASITVEDAMVAFDVIIQRGSSYWDSFDECREILNNVGGENFEELLLFMLENLKETQEAENFSIYMSDLDVLGDSFFDELLERSLEIFGDDSERDGFGTITYTGEDYVVKLYEIPEDSEENQLLYTLHMDREQTLKLINHSWNYLEDSDGHNLTH